LDWQVEQHDLDTLPLPRFHLRAGAAHVTGQAIDPRAHDGVAWLQIGEHFFGDWPFGEWRRGGKPLFPPNDDRRIRVVARDIVANDADLLIERRAVRLGLVRTAHSGAGVDATARGGPRYHRSRRHRLSFRPDGSG
jgi:hypothetical protein